MSIFVNGFLRSSCLTPAHEASLDKLALPGYTWLYINWHCQDIYLIPYTPGAASKKGRSGFSRHGLENDINAEPSGLSERQVAEMIRSSQRIYVVPLSRR
jgi:hypothetical protein